MSKLLITTQTWENYGTDMEPYWKPKGGSDYVVKKFRDVNSVTEVMMALRSQVECDNDYYREHIIGWEIVADDYLTEFEKDQLEYEGQIRFPSKELAW
jgi:hypothetical protein